MRSKRRDALADGNPRPRHDVDEIDDTKRHPVEHFRLLSVA